MARVDNENLFVWHRDIARRDLGSDSACFLESAIRGHLNIIKKSNQRFTTLEGGEKIKIGKKQPHLHLTTTNGLN